MKNKPTYEELVNQIKDLLNCCELNLDEIEPETEEAIDNAFKLLLRVEGYL